MPKDKILDFAKILYPDDVDVQEEFLKKIIEKGLIFNVDLDIKSEEGMKLLVKTLNYSTHISKEVREFITKSFLKEEDLDEKLKKFTSVYFEALSADKRNYRIYSSIIPIYKDLELPANKIVNLFASLYPDDKETQNELFEEAFSQGVFSKEDFDFQSVEGREFLKEKISEPWMADSRPELLKKYFDSDESLDKKIEEFAQIVKNAEAKNAIDPARSFVEITDWYINAGLPSNGLDELSEILYPNDDRAQAIFLLKSYNRVRVNEGSLDINSEADMKIFKEADKNLPSDNARVELVGQYLEKEQDPEKRFIKFTKLFDKRNFAKDLYDDQKFVMRDSIAKKFHEQKLPSHKMADLCYNLYTEVDDEKLQVSLFLQLIKNIPEFKEEHVQEIKKFTTGIKDDDRALEFLERLKEYKIENYPKVNFTELDFLDMASNRISLKYRPFEASLQKPLLEKVDAEGNSIKGVLTSEGIENLNALFGEEAVAQKSLKDLISYCEIRGDRIEQMAVWKD